MENTHSEELPVISLEIIPEPPAAPSVSAVSLTEVAKNKEYAAPEAVLSEQEQRMVEDFIPKIDLRNANTIHQFGSATQKKMSDFSENVLSSVRTKDFGEVGEMLGNVVAELKSFQAEEDKGFFGGLFKKVSQRTEMLKIKYDKVDGNIQRICKTLEEHQIRLLKDTALLDKMYEMNLLYFKELSLYIIAGKKKLELVRTTELRELSEKAQLSGFPEDIQAANDLEAMCTRFEKKIYDLELTRMISIQSAPQIRLVQNNNTLMSDKIQSTLVNTIPLWRSQMVLVLGVEHSRQAAKAQRQVTDMTNELLRKNAEALKMATIETAKESERGIVDLDTLRQTNQALISTFDEVIQIQQDGRRKRREAETELRKLENELADKMLSLARENMAENTGGAPPVPHLE